MGNGRQLFGSSRTSGSRSNSGVMPPLLVRRLPAIALPPGKRRTATDQRSGARVRGASSRGQRPIGVGRRAGTPSARGIARECRTDILMPQRGRFLQMFFADGLAILRTIHVAGCPISARGGMCEGRAGRARRKCVGQCVDECVCSPSMQRSIMGMSRRATREIGTRTSEVRPWASGVGTVILCRARHR
jgi:hypothetical protein